VVVLSDNEWDGGMGINTVDGVGWWDGGRVGWGVRVLGAWGGGVVA